MGDKVSLIEMVDHKDTLGVLMLMFIALGINLSVWYYLSLRVVTRPPGPPAWELNDFRNMTRHNSRCGTAPYLDKRQTVLGWSRPDDIKFWFTMSDESVRAKAAFKRFAHLQYYLFYPKDDDVLKTASSSGGIHLGFHGDWENEVWGWVTNTHPVTAYSFQKHKGYIRLFKRRVM